MNTPDALAGFPGSDFRGAAVIIKGNEIVYSRASGYAALADRIPNTLDTRFAIASGSKTFVAAGILRLIDSGALRLDSTLGELVDLDFSHIDKDVTVMQLLNHTSGVPDYFDESVMDDYEALWKSLPNYSIRRNSDMLRLFTGKPMIYPRGERFQYNNSGYILLAHIIEAVTGMPFDVYLKESVFDVCGMTSAGYFEFDRLPARCANSYIYCKDTDDYRTNIYSVEVKGDGAGGAFVTTGDIIAFWRALIDGRLLSRELTERMMSKQSGDGIDPEEGWYGLGLWIIDNPAGRDHVYLQGMDDGVSFISEYSPDNDIVSVLVSNYGDNVWALMRELRAKQYRN